MQRRTKKPNENMFELLIALLFLLPLGVIYFGFQVISSCLISVLTCCFFELMCNFLVFKKWQIGNLSPVVTGFIIALLLPAGVRPLICILAGLVSILVAKFPFGGYGNNIFNPAAAGLAFVALSFKNEVFSYQVPLTEIGELRGSILSDLTHNSLEIEKFHLLIGNQPGAIGSVQILILVAGLIFLCYHSTISRRIVWSLLITISVIAFLFPRADGRLNSVFFELFSGMLFFAAIFMATDPITSPKFPIGQMIYGMTIGILTMLFRYNSGQEEGVIFSILIANSLVDILDTSEKKRIRIKRRTG